MSYRPRWACLLSRLSTADIVREAQRCAIAATISDKTVWRWLNQDAIRPWRHRSWIFPRDPDFAVKAGRILDLYARQWQGRALKSDEFVISADEKTSIQARIRKHLSLPPRPAQAARIEHEYARAGAWAYMAALDVHRAKVFGRCEETTGIKPFDRLVAQVMANSPYRDARHVFWIVDNGSSHRGQPSVRRLQAAFPNLVLVHGPVHASWLNQIEIYFSIVQRKALTPNDFSSLADVEDRLLRFQQYYETIARALRVEIQPRRPRRPRQKDRPCSHYAPSRSLASYVAKLMNRGTKPLLSCSVPNLF